MANKIIKQPIITFRIERGKPTPVHKQMWKRFWQKLIAEAKSEATK